MAEQFAFQRSAPYTVGVELEFQLLDPETFDLVSKGPALLEKVPAHLTERIKAEFIQSMVEVTTSVCKNIAEIKNDLAGTCESLEKFAEESGCLVFAASLHPFALVKNQRLSPGERYAALMDDLQIAGRRMITQGLHVHVGMNDGQKAVYVCDRIRAYLPILLALTTSSPFYQGDDTGFFSYRSRLFHALPRSGVPETLGDWPRFQELLELLKGSKLIRNIRDLWWDVRPHPDFGTVEVRICDLPSRFDEILAMAALIQALVAFLTEMGPEKKQEHMEVILNNKWQAARYGLAGKYIGVERRGPITFAQAAGQLLGVLRPFAEQLGGMEYLRPIERVLTYGTSARQQKKMWEESYDFSVIIEKLRGDFWK